MLMWKQGAKGVSVTKNPIKSWSGYCRTRVLNTFTEVKLGQRIWCQMHAWAQLTFTDDWRRQRKEFKKPLSSEWFMRPLILWTILYCFTLELGPKENVNEIPTHEIADKHSANLTQKEFFCLRFKVGNVKEEITHKKFPALHRQPFYSMRN